MAWSGGRIVIGKNLKINHLVIFQGKGTVKIGDDVSLGYKLGGASKSPILLQPRETDSLIIIGNGSVIVNGTEIIARKEIVIGENCLIGAKCTLLDADFHGIKPMERKDKGKSSRIVINDNVWIGVGVLILKGVEIGKDAVIGAGCVVSKNVPAGSIVVGNPMKITGSVYDQ